MAPAPKPLEDRILAAVVIDDNGCWLWQKYVKPNGYGQIGVPGRGSCYVHRVSYEVWRGSIPEGKQLDHLCRVRRCCNPEHLEPVTCRTNLLRGQGPTAERAAVEFCQAGHPYDEENTYHRPRRGGRDCRACRLEAVRREQARGRSRHHSTPVGERVWSGRAIKNACPQGHPYDGENLYVDSRGHRQCRICRREAVRRHQQTRLASA